jgi:hypothetical protein
MMSRKLSICATALFFAHAAADASAKQIASASGAGSVVAFDAPTHFSFHISRDPDDAASGQANIVLFLVDDTFHITADLDYLAIVGGDTAIVSGVIQTSTLPQGGCAPDNGEGDSSVDGLTGVFGFEGASPDLCLRPLGFRFEDVTGNVQVRRGPIDE